MRLNVLLVGLNEQENVPNSRWAQANEEQTKANSTKGSRQIVAVNVYTSSKCRVVVGYCRNSRPKMPDLFGKPKVDRYAFWTVEREQLIK